MDENALRLNEDKKWRMENAHPTQFFRLDPLRSVFYRNPIGSPVFSYEDKKTAFSLKDYINQARRYDAEEVMVERYEDIDGRKNTLTWKERVDSFQQSKSGAQPSAQWMSDDDLDPEAMEREDAEHNDPRYQNLDPLETLKTIANRFPGSGQFKRDQDLDLGSQESSSWLA